MNPAEPSAFLEVIAESSLVENHPQMIEITGRKIVLVKTNGEYFALDNTCPHLGGSLARGTVRSHCLVCPLHHWSFDLSTGGCRDGVAGEKVQTYEIRIEKGKILLKLA